MLTATIPFALQLLEAVTGVVLAGLTAVGIYATGYYLVRGRKAAASDTVAQSAIMSLTGELTAVKSANERLETALNHETEVRKKQDRIIESQNERISSLERLITGRDLIEALDHTMRTGFRELGVPESVFGGAA